MLYLSGKHLDCKFMKMYRGGRSKCLINFLKTINSYISHCNPPPQKLLFSFSSCFVYAQLFTCFLNVSILLRLNWLCLLGANLTLIRMGSILWIGYTHCQTSENLAWGKHWVLVSQSCLIFCNPVGCSLPDSSLYRIFQARILEWVGIPFSMASSDPGIVCIAGRFFTVWATREDSLRARKWDKKTWRPRN